MHPNYCNHVGSSSSRSGLERNSLTSLTTPVFPVSESLAFLSVPGFNRIPGNDSLAEQRRFLLAVLSEAIAIAEATLPFGDEDEHPPEEGVQ
jgi:hypothetical protein